MDGRRHLEIGAVSGAIASTIAISTFNYSNEDLISVPNVVAVSIILSSLLSLSLPDELSSKIPIKIIPPKLIATAIMSVAFIFLSSIDMGATVVYCIFGSVLGSLIPDLDSSRSTINKYANRIIIATIVLYIIGFLIKSPIVSNMIRDNNFIFIIIFCILCVLGKMSPHREFTHKLLGFVLFSFTFYFISPFIMWICFMIGYITHVLADKTTPAGKKYHPFDLKFPMQKSDNTFDLKDSVKHLYKSTKVH